MIVATRAHIINCLTLFLTTSRNPLGFHQDQAPFQLPHTSTHQCQDHCPGHAVQRPEAVVDKAAVPPPSQLAKQLGGGGMQREQRRQVHVEGQKDGLLDGEMVACQQIGNELRTQVGLVGNGWE